MVGDKSLKIISETLERFNQNNIMYCHFKSNEHVDAAIYGDTDLDILFDINQKKQVLDVLGSLGYIKYNTVWFVSYPYVEDYIVVSEGKIVHIHAHYRLILGESKVKSYILDYDEAIFKSRIFMCEYGIYASNPIEESLLLLIRTALKLTQSKVKFDKSRDTKDAIREFEWLKQRVASQELIELFKSRFKNTDSKSVLDIYNNNISYENISQFYIDTKSTLDTYRRYSYLKSKLVKVSRELALLASQVNKKFNVFPTIVNHRTLPNSGMIVAIMGADGSGKSTQTALVQKILAAKMDTRYIYMGSGNGKASLHRSLLKFVQRGFAKLENSKKNKTSFTSKVFWMLNSLSLAVEKKSKLKLANKLRKKGMVVITDRYPQTTILGYNDGPLIAKYARSSNIIIKLIARFELNNYKKAEAICPDLVVKLLADPDVLYKRRKDVMAMDMIVKKQDGIKSLAFDKETKVCEIDAALAIDVVSKKIINEIGHVATAKNRIVNEKN